MDVDFLKYKFEDGGVGVAVEKRYRIGIRHVQITYMTACGILLGLVRGGNGIGIAMMTDPSRRNDTYLQVFTWSRPVQGCMLSSFLWGYALALAPATLCLRKFGGKLVLAAVLLVEGLLYAALPTIAKEGGWAAVSNAQFIIGMTQACFAPATQALLDKWLPPHERKFYGPIVYAGIQIGTIISFPVTSRLVPEPLGWELVFYSLAMLLVAGTVVWVLLTAGSPDDHPAAGNTEREFVKDSIRCFERRHLETPWRIIVRSRAVWAGAAAHCACACVFVYYLTEIPIYLVYGLKIPVDTSGWYACWPLLAAWLTYVAVSPTLEWACNAGFVTYVLAITRYRKLIHCFGGLGSVIGLIWLSQLGPESSYLALFLITAVLASNAVQYCGFVECYRDMSQNFSQQVLLVSSLVASVAVASLPLLNGLILGDDLCDLSRWRVSLRCVSAASAAGAVLFAAAGCAERQTWDCLGLTKFAYLNDIDHVELEDLKEKPLSDKENNN